MLRLDYDDRLPLARLQALHGTARKAQVRWLRAARNVEDRKTFRYVTLGRWATRHARRRCPSVSLYGSPQTVHGTYTGVKPRREAASA